MKNYEEICNIDTRMYQSFKTLKKTAVFDLKIAFGRRFCNHRKNILEYIILGNFDDV